MALSDNVIKAMREHIKRNDNPGEVANAKAILDKHQLPYVEATGKKEGPSQPFDFDFNDHPDVGDGLFETLRKMREEMLKHKQEGKRQGTGSNQYQKGSWNKADDFFARHQEHRRPEPEPEIPKNYYFRCESAAEAVVAGMIFKHFNKGIVKNCEWLQNEKRFFMNQTTEWIANRTKDSFVRYKEYFADEMLKKLNDLIKLVL